MVKNFLKEYKLSKSLGYSEGFRKGDSITLFNNKYKVMSDNGAKMTMLKDLRETMFAIPTDKLKKLLVKSTMTKSNGSMSPKGFAAAKKAEASGSLPGAGKGHAAPLYTVHNEKMKVQMNPPKWIHVKTGHSYEHPYDADDQHHGVMQNEDDLNNAQKFHKNIIMKTSPEDHAKLKKLINDFLGKQRQASNMKDVHRGTTQGGKQAPKELLENASNLNETAMMAWKKFTEAYKDSVKKVKLEEAKRGRH